MTALRIRALPRPRALSRASLGIAAALAVLASAASAGDAPAAKADPKAGAKEEGREKGKPEAGKPLAAFDVIKYVDPFSPDPPKKPEPPKPPTPPTPPPPEPKRVKVAPDNLCLSGVTWDTARKALTALIEVEGGGPKFLQAGAKVGHWEILAVEATGIELKGPDGAAKKIELGAKFHDGVTFIERIEGGAPPPSAPTPAAQPASEAPAATPALDDAKRKEIIERLKAKRAGGGK